MMAAQCNMAEGYRRGSKQSMPLEMTTDCSRKKLIGQRIYAPLRTYLCCSRPFTYCQISSGRYLLRLPMGGGKPWHHKGALGRLQCCSPGYPAGMFAMGCMGITPARQAGDSINNHSGAPQNLHDLSQFTRGAPPCAGRRDWNPPQGGKGWLPAMHPPDVTPPAAAPCDPP